MWLWSLACALEPMDEVAVAMGEERAPVAELQAGDGGAAGGLVYEVYVRSFQDSDGDGVGDFEGLRQRLPHLQGLGVTALWLMPVFQADGVAGYGVVDHERLAPELGTDEDFDAMVAEAHARGMRVWLDLPFNHVSSQHPWFQAALQGDAAARERFRFSDTQWDTERWYEAEPGTYYYAFFAPYLPDLDWTEPEVETDMTDRMSQWLDRVDGFRLDAPVALIENVTDLSDTPETHALLARLGAALRREHPQATLLAEASCADVATSLEYLGTEEAPEADLALDFPRHEALVGAFAEGEPSALAEVLLLEGDDAVRMATFLGSHDLPRLRERVTDPLARQVLLAAAQLLPGLPVLYYGEEIDLDSARPSTAPDLVQRAPMAWDTSSQAGFTDATPWFTPSPSFRVGRNVADESLDPGSVLALLRSLARVRAAHPVLVQGGLGALEVDGSWLRFERVLGQDTAWVELDTGPTPCVRVFVDDQAPIEWQAGACAR